MKILQLLLDGYHQDNTGYQYFNECTPSLANYSRATINSIYPRCKRLNSPYMWGRTLAGKEFPSKASVGFKPTQTDKDAAERQGYTQVDPSLWIWNILAAKGIPSFILPYYLCKVIDRDNILTDNQIATIYTRDYDNSEYRVITGLDDRIIQSARIYDCLCDKFDHSSDLGLNADLKRFWKAYLAGEVSELDKTHIIDNIRAKKIPGMIEGLHNNQIIYDEEISPLMKSKLSGEDNYFIFLGITETDAIMHYAKPYPEVYTAMSKLIDHILQDIVENLDPDVIIVHGDHNMTDDFQGFGDKYRISLDYDSIHYDVAKAGANDHIMYSDHGNRHGAYVFYKDNSTEVVQSLVENSDDIVLESIRNWIINKAFR